MIIEMPDKVKISEERFDGMVTSLSALMFLLASREKFRVIIDRNPESGEVTINHIHDPATVGETEAGR